MKKLIYALRFLTILPINWKQDEDMTDVARSTICFPFVGLLIGGVLSLTLYYLNILVSPLMSSTITVIMWVIITGGLHLDGLSDLADGLGGRSVEDRLRIMKDSRVGAFGALSLIVIIIGKVVLLRELLLMSKGALIIYPLMLTPVWAKISVILSIRFFKTARPDGMGNFFKKSMRNREWIIPLTLFTFLSIYLLSIYALTAAMLLILMLLISRSISKKLNGLTGDCYGAIGEVSELLFLLIYILLLSIGSK